MACVLITAMLALLIVVLGSSWVLIQTEIVLGLALGGGFALGLSLIVLRAGDTVTTGVLSAMAQSFGYSLASLGPLGFGLVHDASGGCAWPSALFCAIAFAALVCGLVAGRDRQIGIAGSLSPDVVRTG